MRKRQTETTCEHQEAGPGHVQLHEVIRLLSKVTATLYEPLDIPRDCGGVTVALKWNPICKRSFTARDFNRFSPL